METEEDCNQLLPRNVKKESLYSLEDNFKNSKPDATRVDKYTFRGVH